MNRNNHDSPRSMTYAKQDSGFVTNSSLSRDASPTRDSLIRKTLSQSPSLAMGKYVLDRYKSPAIESMRSHALISTFEELELEKLMLKDENSDMREKVYQFQSSLRQLEASRSRDAERFELQEREVQALRHQVKAEKDGKQAVNALAEELQSDLTRKSDLLAIDIKIDTRERLRQLDKQFREEAESRNLTERSAREIRERLDDISVELEMERKMRKAASESERELKDQVTQLERETSLFMQAIKDVGRTFESSTGKSVNPAFHLPNREAEERLQRILTVRDELHDKFNALQGDVSNKELLASNLSDDLSIFARILRLEVKDDVVPGSLLNDSIFREQRTCVSNARVSPPMELLQSSLLAFLEYEMKKRKVMKEAIDGCLKKFNWKGVKLNETQIIPLLNAVLLSWNNYRDNNVQMRKKLAATRSRVVAASRNATEAALSIRTVMTQFKNSVLISSRHQLDEELYRFADRTKAKHASIRKLLDISHQTKTASEIGKVRVEHEAKLTDAVNSERRRIQQLESELASLNTSFKLKEEYVIKLASDIRDKESKMFRITEETKEIQKGHALSLAAAGQDRYLSEKAMQTKMDELQSTFEMEIAKLKRDLDNRARTIAVLDQAMVEKDQRLTAVQTKLKDRVKKHEVTEKELAAEKDPSKSHKLLAAIKTYEREVSELRGKVTERDALVAHLKKRVDEALNRGQKKANEATERSRAELFAKDAKFAEKEKEVEKLQDQLTRLSRVVSKSTMPARLMSSGAESSRTTVLSAVPTVRSASNPRSVSGTDLSDSSKLPPIPTAGVVGGDMNANGQAILHLDDKTNSTIRSTIRQPSPHKGSYAIFRSYENLNYESSDKQMTGRGGSQLDQESSKPPWRPTHPTS